MNSRDAAYDEEEQLRQAIEASKAEKSLKEGSTGHRKGKRARGESEEYVGLIPRIVTVQNDAENICIVGLVGTRANVSGRCLDLPQRHRKSIRTRLRSRQTPTTMNERAADRAGLVVQLRLGYIKTRRSARKRRRKEEPTRPNGDGEGQDGDGETVGRTHGRVIITL